MQTVPPAPSPPSRKSEPWTDYKAEQIMGRLLRIGVLTASAVALVGAVFYLGRHGSQEPHYRVFLGEPTDLRSIGGILSELFHLQPRAIVQFGILLLIATPVARVAFSVYAFAREGDRTYTLVTSIVLALLAFSLCLTP